jgi:hypothetical protein
MTDPNFAMFQYQHSDRVVRSGKVWLAWGAIVALLAASILFLGVIGIILTIIVAVFLGKRFPRRAIYLGPRFMVCGNTIAYYKNVRRMALKPGELTIFWGEEDSFRLEEKRFPTGARKQHKIKANKAAKFGKVAAKIIERVQIEVPGVKLDGKGWTEIMKSTQPRP